MNLPNYRTGTDSICYDKLNLSIGHSTTGVTSFHSDWIVMNFPTYGTGNASIYHDKLNLSLRHSTTGVISLDSDWIV